MSKTTRKQREIDWLIRDKYAGKRDEKKMAGDLARLKKGEPIDYVIGWREFLSCRVDLSKKPLIPREETEFWVGQEIKKINRARRIKCLDIFAGSGCIGLAVLKHLPNARVDFAEKSKKQIKQIKINLKLNGVAKDRAREIESNIFSNLSGKYDLIFANPPYVPAKRKLSASVTKYEPKTALFSGEDGLTVIRQFLKDSLKHLNNEGKIFMEFDSTQKSRVDKLLKTPGYSSWQFHRDQFGRWRWVEIIK